MILQKLNKRISAIDHFVDAHGYASYDPYDGLSSPIFRFFPVKSQLVSRLFQQSVRLFPVNVRPLLAVNKMVHTKTVSDFASAYCNLYKIDNNPIYKKKAQKCLKHLKNLTSPTKSGMGWGLRFPFATRFIQADGFTANIFQTINAIHAYLDGYETFQEEDYLSIAKQGFLFLENDLKFIETENTLVWNYWENLDAKIYNVSGLMVGLCARMWSVTQLDKYYRYTKKLYSYLKDAQNVDGSWNYSADERGKFIDGFHTGYILEGVVKGVMAGILQIDQSFEKAVSFYLANFFTQDWTPRYFPNKTYPIDGQNAAQALQTLHFILNVNFATIKQSTNCFQRIDYLLWNEKGYYNYKKTAWITYKTPMHRWVTAPMFLALTHLNTTYAKQTL